MGPIGGIGIGIGGLGGPGGGGITIGGAGIIGTTGGAGLPSGRFRAGAYPGIGYVIAYDDSVFGDTGTWSPTGSAKVVVELALPVAYALAQNYPDPFNPTTTITYDLPDMAQVRLMIYDLSGQAVRTLVHNYHHQPGRYAIVWDGRDDAGHEVFTGLYLYRLTAGEFTATRKMVLMPMLLT
jgi:hypothetical protein